MTLTEMVARLALRLGYDLDNYAGETPSTADQYDQINFAARTVARHVHHSRAGVALTVTSNVFQYSLHGSAFSQPMIEVWNVINNGTMLVDYLGQPGLHSYQEMNKEFPGWQTGSVSGALSTVVAACQVGTELWLYKKPTGGGTLYVDGRCLPVKMTSGSDVSELHIDLHEAIVDIAAIYAADPSASDNQAIARLQSYSQRSYQTLSDVREENIRLNRLRRGQPPFDDRVMK